MASIGIIRVGSFVNQFLPLFSTETRDHIHDDTANQCRQSHADDRTKKQAWPESRIEESIGDGMRREPVTRRQLPRQNAVDPEETHPGRKRIQAQQSQACSITKLIVISIEAVSSDDFQTEKRPLSCPDPVKIKHHLANRRRTDLNRRKPDAYASQRSQHKADQHQHFKVAMHEDACIFAPTGHGQPLEVAQQNAAADCELGEKHVDNRNCGHHQTGHQRSVVVDRIDVDHCVSFREVFASRCALHFIIASQFETTRALQE